MLNESPANLIRAMVAQTTAAGKPSDLVFGVVTSDDPLEIKIDDKRTLAADFIMLSDMVRDYEVDISVSHMTETKGGGSGDASYESHAHAYRGRKKITVHNKLKNGEKVIMLRQAGGQLFYVLCRVAEHAELTGEWS